MNSKIPVLVEPIVQSQIPFILQNLVKYEGATGATTTGTYDNVDGSDDS